MMFTDTDMMLTVLAVYAFPFLPVYSSARLVRLQLERDQASNFDPASEEAYISSKYGAINRRPLFGTGGSGRQITQTYFHDQRPCSIHEDFGGGHSTPLNNSRNSKYTTRIQVGTPPVEFRVIVDTGSSVLWIPGAECGQDCAKHPIYDSSNSDTFKPNGTKGTVRYVTGWMQGITSNDVVKIGGVEVKGQDFLKATQTMGVPDFSWDSRKPKVLPVYDGVLGLAYNALAVNHMTPPFYNMINQGHLDEPLFSIRLGPSQDDAGEIIFGGIDEELYSGPITYLPVRRQQHWDVELSKFTFNGEEFSVGDGSAAFDTGASVIIVPLDIVATIHASTKIRRRSDGTYITYCSDTHSLPSLNFHFGERRFTVRGSDYFAPHADFPDICISSVFGRSVSQHEPQWVLGGPFLRRYYSIYNLENNTVGLADSN